MDLDKLKETWQNADINHSIKEDEIQQILSTKGQGAFNRIQWYEKIGFITSILLIIGGAILITLSHTLLMTANDTIPIFITISSVFLLIWNIYKKSFFKKINIATMSLLYVSKAINTYKRYLAIEGVVAFVWTATFAIIFVSTQIFYLNLTEQVILGLLICIFSSLISYIAYRFTIIKDLKTIKNAIQEVEEFEKENIEQK